MSLPSKPCLRSRKRLIVILVLAFVAMYALNILWDTPFIDWAYSFIRRNKIEPKATTKIWQVWNDMRTMLLLNTVDRSLIVEFKKSKLMESLKAEKGKRCQIPFLNPFSRNIMQFDKNYTKITCDGFDWVKCHYAECTIRDEIITKMEDVTCTYRDIVYINERNYYLGVTADLYWDTSYTLIKSDHVKVNCSGRPKKGTTWEGIVAGFRNSLDKPFRFASKDTVNVLIFGFDSASRNGFMRRMPKSYKYLVEELNVTVLTSYNIVGDGTAAALFPLLSGKTELEYPDVRKLTNNTVDADEFIFAKVEKKGYRTAYFEDSPTMGTFQWRFNGFNKQPAYHYLRSFFLEDMQTSFKTYCVGDTPRYRLLMNLTQQFLKIQCKRFIFTFIADICHNNFNQISTADNDTVEFLEDFKESGLTKDTIIFFMGDHGARYSNVRSTVQGRIEERLPLMAIRLPDSLVSRRPSAAAALKKNRNTLTTPHDIHATILDVLNLTHLQNPYRVPGADLPRALTLFRKIPKNRTCSEAGIEPHWCTCLSWKSIDKKDPLYQRAADALVASINLFTEPVRSKCVLRKLKSISSVAKKEPNDNLLSFIKTDRHGFVETYGPSLDGQPKLYQVKLTVSPGESMFEATMNYARVEDVFKLDMRHVSRINKYNNEPACIQATHVHLEKFCYCKNHNITQN